MESCPTSYPLPPPKCPVDVKRESGESTWSTLSQHFNFYAEVNGSILSNDHAWACKGFDCSHATCSQKLNNQSQLTCWFFNQSWRKIKDMRNQTCVCLLLKTPANEGNVLAEHISLFMRTSDICCGNKLFRRRTESSFCFQETKLKCFQMLHARANEETFRETMIPQQCFFFCGVLYAVQGDSYVCRGWNPYKFDPRDVWHYHSKELYCAGHFFDTVLYYAVQLKGF